MRRGVRRYNRTVAASLRLAAATYALSALFRCRAAAAAAFRAMLPLRHARCAFTLLLRMRQRVTLAVRGLCITQQRQHHALGAVQHRVDDGGGG